MPAQRAKAAREAGADGRLTRLRHAVVAWLRALTGRRLASAVVAVVVAATAAVVWVVLSRDGARSLPDTRARHYEDVDACLLTGDKGIAAGTTAAIVWQGMQDASAKTRARVSYASVTGEQSAANAVPYLNGLLQRSCDVVVAAGTPAVAAAEQTASRYGKVGFVLVGADAHGKRRANVTVTGAGDGLRSEVASAVTHAVDSRD